MGENDARLRKTVFSFHILFHVQHLHELPEQGGGIELRLQLSLLHHDVSDDRHSDISWPFKDVKIYKIKFLFFQRWHWVSALFSKERLLDLNHSKFKRIFNWISPHVQHNNSTRMDLIQRNVYTIKSNFIFNIWRGEEK